MIGFRNYIRDSLWKVASRRFSPLYFLQFPLAHLWPRSIGKSKSCLSLWNCMQNKPPHPSGVGENNPNLMKFQPPDSVSSSAKWTHLMLKILLKYFTTGCGETAYRCPLPNIFLSLSFSLQLTNIAWTLISGTICWGLYIGSAIVHWSSS